MPRHNDLTSRRELLKVGLGALPVITIGGSMPFLVPKFAFAQDAPGTPIPKDNILVIVQLSGGNDGLNTVVPFKHDTYKKIRPRIALSERLHALSDEYALNPGMTAFKRMFDEGTLAVIHGCGYPQPNRSHFESMAIWHAAQTDGGGGSGWLGHYLDHLARGTQNKDIANNPLLGVNIGREVPQALVSPEITVPSVDSIDDFGLRFDEGSNYDKELERQIIIELNKYKGENPAMEYLGRQATDAIISADEIRSVAGKYSPDADYPGGLGQRLRLIAQLISGNFGTRVFYCEMGGYDTHANQVQQHENLLNQVAESISAFYVDLGKKGIADKVTVMCFSEFGRRVEQNANDGTDHGAAGPMFVCGPKVQGGLYGTHPSLEALEQGDLAFTTDFRTVYAAMLTHWLNADADTVLQAHFDPLPLIKGVQPPAQAQPTTQPATQPTTQPTTQPADGAAPPAGGGMMQMQGGGMMQGGMTGAAKPE